MQGKSEFNISIHFYNYDNAELSMENCKLWTGIVGPGELGSRLPAWRRLPGVSLR